ncbi:MAG: helix-turn-helix domain-containing protein [Elusimicrobiota bacterium]|nr:MAG: helix-turn-helix domain-containing protein [Elusimicrobiota bacterium]
MKADNKDAWLAIGRRIKEERERRRLTQHALADAAGLSDKFISNLERGSRQPATKSLQAIAGALGIEPKDLYTGVPSTYKPLDADLAQLASILKDASPKDRAVAIRMVKSLIQHKK